MDPKDHEITIPPSVFVQCSCCGTTYFQTDPVVISMALSGTRRYEGYCGISKLPRQVYTFVEAPTTSQPTY